MDYLFYYFDIFWKKIDAVLRKKASSEITTSVRWEELTQIKVPKQSDRIWCFHLFDGTLSQRYATETLEFGMTFVVLKNWENYFEIFWKRLQPFNFRQHWISRRVHNHIIWNRRISCVFFSSHEGTTAPVIHITVPRFSFTPIIIWYSDGSRSNIS